MTTSITHTPEQEAAIRYRRRQWNLTATTPLTAGQYADMRVAELFNNMVADVKTERESQELQTAFKAATPSVQTNVKTLLGIVEP